MGDLVSNSSLESSFESEVSRQKNEVSSSLNVCGLFVGFSPKSSESDSVKSPTSPLDLWVFTNLANSFVRSPRSPHMRWGNSKVGLSIIESLDDINARQSSDSRNILMKTPFFRSSVDTLDASKSLLKDHGVFTRTQIKPSNLQKGSSNVVLGIGENPLQAESFENFRPCSLDSGKSRLTNFSIDSNFENFGSKTRMSPLDASPKLLGENQLLGDSSAVKPTPISNPVSSARDFVGSLSTGEIELSEDYTCVKTFGPNPKTTHIFGDSVLECHDNSVPNLYCTEERKIQFEAPISYPSNYFLSQCYSCKKKLEGIDIYMYRGEKAFCSPDCRSHEISIEEKEEKVSAASLH